MYEGRNHGLHHCRWARIRTTRNSAWAAPSSALSPQGHRVHLIDATSGEPTPFGSEEIRAVEKAKAAEILGVSRTLVGLKNREVVHNIESRHKMAAVSASIARTGYLFLTGLTHIPIMWR